MHLEFRHPEYQRPIITSRIMEIRHKCCPEPVLVRIEGSNWGGSTLKACFGGPRHAPGIPASGIPTAHHHLAHHGNPAQVLISGPAGRLAESL